METKYFLYAGGITPFFFWITTFISGFIQGNYHHLSGLVSDLGRVGTRSQFVFMIGLLACSLLGIFFISGLYRLCRIFGFSTVPVVILSFFSISIAGAAIFPLPHPLHGIMGMPSVLLLLSPIMAILMWRGKKLLPKLTPLALLSILFMVLGSLAFIPEVLGNYPGLKQRFFHIGWSIWFLYLAYSFITLARRRT